MSEFDPRTDYERALETYDLDCSQVGCWHPGEVLVGRTLYCLVHADPDAVTLVLET